MLIFTKLPVKTIPVEVNKGSVEAERFLRSMINAIQGNRRGRTIPQNEDRGIVVAAES